MRVAVLYICTGKYSAFWQQFYESAEQYFFPKSEKRYFVFSDTLNGPVPGNVTLIHQGKMGWPLDTLMRFKLFQSIRDQLTNFDWIFFCNANLRFLKGVSHEILVVDDTFVDLIAVQHPFFFWVNNPKDFPYERRSVSNAYIPVNKGEVYVMGGFNGGSVKAYLELIDVLKDRIDADYNKNIIALWHDESHLNRYIFETNKRVRMLPYNYGFPEGHDLPLKNDVFITFLDKAAFGGHDFLREKENSIPQNPQNHNRSSILWLKNKIKSLF